MRDGAAAAVEVINASGLLPDHAKVVLSVADDGCDPRQAVEVANKLATERVLLVVGHFCSASSIAASDIYAEAGIVQVSPGSSSPRLTERGLQTVFRICGRDDQQGILAAEYIYANHPTITLRCSTTRARLVRVLPTWLKPSFIDSGDGSLGKATSPVKRTSER
ncbi:branched-chain amino acid ABC transporter substrate-binding protein [Bradyrhizobium centrosematis]|uniref:branched-chain amino acid ABC transporter substrate-binding protein n=1 Tax=Bradyrhizobium centrosematis TaxID=1300039 RepID=UPI00388D42ED